MAMMTMKIANTGMSGKKATDARGSFSQGDTDGDPAQEGDGENRTERADDVTDEIGPAQALPAHR